MSNQKELMNVIPSSLVEIEDFLTPVAWKVVDNDQIEASSRFAIKKQVDSAMAAIHRRIKKRSHPRLTNFFFEVLVLITHPVYTFRRNCWFINRMN